VRIGNMAGYIENGKLVGHSILIIPATIIIINNLRGCYRPSRVTRGKRQFHYYSAPNAGRGNRKLQMAPNASSVKKYSYYWECNCIYSTARGYSPQRSARKREKKDTPWRQVNSPFLITHLHQLQPDAFILDVGAGRGDFIAYYRTSCWISIPIQKRISPVI